jgi:prefoldin subunit 5
MEEIQMSGYDYSQEVANELLEASDVELESLRQQLAECHATNGKLREALDAVQQVANRSEGIAGWHLNGDIASWDSILPEVDEALAISNDATALNELIAERTKTQKEYYESVFQDGANRIAELTAEVEYWKTIRTENAVYFEKREAELTAQRDVAIGILEHIRRCIPYGGFAQIHDGSATVADIDAAIANCKEPGK